MSDAKIKGEVLRETDKAFQIKVRKKTVWIPKSQVSYRRVIGGVTELDIPEWLALKNGIWHD